jgi:hypothetical protein
MERWTRFDELCVALIFVRADLDGIRKRLLEQPDPASEAELLGQIVEEINKVLATADVPTPGAERQRRYRARKRREAAWAARDVGDAAEGDDSDWYSGA